VEQTGHSRSPDFGGETVTSLLTYQLQHGGDWLLSLTTASRGLLRDEAARV